jgi:hypothetical protein
LPTVGGKHGLSVGETAFAANGRTMVIKRCGESRDLPIQLSRQSTHSRYWRRQHERAKVVPPFSSCEPSSVALLSSTVRLLRGAGLDAPRARSESAVGSRSRVSQNQRVGRQPQSRTSHQQGMTPRRINPPTRQGSCQKLGRKRRYRVFEGARDPESDAEIRRERVRWLRSVR